MMLLDLKSVIAAPGAEREFSCELDTERLDFPFIRAYTGPIECSGRVVNQAGVLHLNAQLVSPQLCVCDRCGREFPREVRENFSVLLSEHIQDEDDAEVFELSDGSIDVEDVLSVCFILNMESKCLCQEDCLGLCPVCGKNLNEGGCGCLRPKDHRLAVLQQLLDDNS